MSVALRRHLNGYGLIHTPRLTLAPLDREQMGWQLDDYAALEHSLGLAASGGGIEAELRSIIARSVIYMEQEPEEAVWNTHWAAILRGDGPGDDSGDGSGDGSGQEKLVGSFGFKGGPDSEGEVEIGYGLDPVYHNRGLATEAVAALADWAFDQPGIQTVTAETHYTNIPSARVLQKAGFVLRAAHSHFLYWQKKNGRTDGPPAQDGNFTLYDLAVVVESINGTCTCSMRVGDRFFLRNSSSLSLPDGGHFCVYALQAVLPLLPAKQRQNHPADWMETDSRAQCPDPACGLIMRIDRTDTRQLRHDDVSPIPWDSI